MVYRNRLQWGHAQLSVERPGLRSVLEGATHNSVPYIQVDHVAYQPIQAAELNLEGDL